MPQCVAIKSATDPEISAQNPSNGLILVILWPMVFTILHPPKRVPRAIAAWQERTTQIGGTFASFEISPEIINATQIIPIDFWASFAPCPRLKAEAEKSWNRRKSLSTVKAGTRLKIHIIIEEKK